MYFLLVLVVALLAQTCLSLPHGFQDLKMNSLMFVSNCQQYSDQLNQTCIKCHDHFYLIQNQCFSCLPGCKDCSDGMECDKCEDGKYVLTQGKSQSCKECKPQCRTCSSENTCNSCREDKGFTLTFRSCVSDKSYLLFLMGLSMCGLITVALVGCIIRCLFCSKFQKNQIVIQNLFQHSLE